MCITPTKHIHALTDPPIKMPPCWAHAMETKFSFPALQVRSHAPNKFGLLEYIYILCHPLKLAWKPIQIHYVWKKEKESNMILTKNQTSLSQLAEVTSWAWPFFFFFFWLTPELASTTLFKRSCVEKKKENRVWQWNIHLMILN